MYNRSKVYLDEQGIFYKSQYGFRDKHSTQHASLDLISQIQTNMDHKLFSCGIFIDLREAFDTVNHSIFLEKHYGIRGIVNNDSFFITKCDTVYYKLRQVLQSAMDLFQIATGIT